MTDKPGEEDLNRQPGAEPENNSIEVAPATNTKNINTNHEAENMEVHHHTHNAHEKRSVKSYFWEFLMLFLAVFCGFLAEYQLEHKIERDRAVGLAKNLYNELKNDSAVIQSKVEYRIRQESALKYLMKYFKDSSFTNISKTFELNFMFGLNFRSPSLFEPRTVILDQLKNSGSLRYFKNDELQKLIGDLSIAVHNINDRQDLESKVRLEYINPIIIHHYDYDFNDQLNQGGKVSIIQATFDYEKTNDFIPFHFSSPEKLDRQFTVNAIGFMCMNVMNSTRTLHFKRYMDVNAELLKVLRKEYHLE